MRVVVYSPSWLPVVDGTSVQSARLADLLERSHDVTRLAYAVDRNMTPRSADLDDRVVRLPAKYLRHDKYPVLDGADAARFITKVHPDVLHVRGWYQLAAAYAVIRAAADCGARLFWHMDGLHECHHHWIERPDYSALISDAVQAGVIFVGNSSADIALITSLGISDGRTRVVLPIVQTIACDKDWVHPSVLSVGRFFRYKRHSEVLRAALSLNVPVILAGAVDSDETLELTGELLRAGGRLMCNPTDSILASLYRASTHFVLASSRETLGIVTLEAVAAHCVPLVRAVGGIRDWLPLRCVLGVEEGLAGRLLSLLDSSVAAAVHQELASLRSKLSFDSIAAAYEQLYV